MTSDESVMVGLHDDYAREFGRVPEPSFTVGRYGGTYSITRVPLPWWHPRGWWGRLRRYLRGDDLTPVGSIRWGPVYDSAAPEEAWEWPPWEGPMSDEEVERRVARVRTVVRRRRGRALTEADFTELGLTEPPLLWNLADTNVEGGRTLTNKGAVPFGKGVTGTGESSVFADSEGRSLYRVEPCPGRPRG